MPAAPDGAGPALWSAGDQAAALARGDLSSRELLDCYLERVESLNGTLNAVVTLDAEAARAEADACDRERAGGRVRGPLHGLPVTIKDAIEVGGMRSTGGAVELAGHVPERDAPAVGRLRSAGAVVFGKTNCPRWSGDFQTYNELFGVTNNPWDPTRTPGGSSGGAAAAVAAGLTSFELGTDIGGSIRIPSHCCGVFGLKPTFGVVSQRGYLDSVGGGTTDADLNVFGPLARSAADLDLLLTVLAQAPPAGGGGWRAELPPAPAELAGLRVGLWLGAPGVPGDSEQRAIHECAAAALEGLGLQVEDSHPAVSFGEQVDLFRRKVLAAVLPSMDPAMAEALAADHLAWLRDDRERSRLGLEWAAWFGSFDLLLCPVLPRPAFPHDNQGEMFERVLEVEGRSMPYIDAIAWAGLIGVVGLPAAAAPVGFTAGGLPVGIQVVAPWFRDRTAVAVAGALAEITGGYQVPPTGAEA